MSDNSKKYLKIELIIFVSLTIVFGIFSAQVFNVEYIGFFFWVFLVLSIIFARRLNKARHKTIENSLTEHYLQANEITKPIEITKSRGSLSGGKKILICVGIIIISLIAIQVTLHETASDETKAKWEEEARMAKVGENELASKHNEMDLASEYAVRNPQLGIWAPVDVSRLSDERYHDLVNTQIESYFLNYKGNDKVGFTIQEVLLMGMRTNCGLDTTLENVDVGTNFMDIDDTIANDKLTFILNISSEKIMCANQMWWFAIDPFTGEVFAWENSAEEDLLNRVN